MKSWTKKTYIGTLYEDMYSPDEDLISAVNDWLINAIRAIPHVVDIREIDDGRFEFTMFGQTFEVEWRFK